VVQTSSRYDVFVSYNRRDADQVKILVTRLERRANLRVWLDVTDLPAGVPWRPAIEEAMNHCAAVLTVYGPHGFGPTQREEFDLAQSVKSAKPIHIVPLLLPQTEPPKGTWFSTYSAVQFLHSLDEPEATVNLVASLKGEPLPRLTEDLPDEPAPYRNLTPFGIEDSAFFFGRSICVQEIFTQLQQHPMLAIVGPSGVGKTSLVQAGVLARLRDGALPGSENWHRLVMTPGTQPLKKLSDTLASLQIPGNNPLPSEAGLADWVRFLERRLAPAGRLVLVVDRLEEAFTLCKNAREQRLFIGFLRALVEMPGDHVWVLVTIRDELVDRIAEADPVLGEEVLRHRMDLGPMTDEEILEVIAEPARRVGAVFEIGLPRQIQREAAAGGYVVLPLLENVLNMLWKRRKGRLLSWNEYERIGFFRGALRNHADAVLHGMTTQEQKIARGIFSRLIWLEGGTHAIVGRRLEKDALLAYFDDRQLAEITLEKLLTGQLLVPVRPPEEADGASAGDILALAHDSLAFHWPILREWVLKDEDFVLWRQRLEGDVEDWLDSRRKEGFLTGSRLSEAEVNLLKRLSDLGPLERELITESQRREERRRERRRQRWVAAVFLSLLIAGLFFYAWRRSLSRALAAEAVQEENQPLDLRLLLSLQADKIADTLEARGSLLTLLEQGEELQRFLPGQNGPISQVAFSPDGRRFATAGSGEIDLWDAEDGHRLWPPFPGYEGRVLGLAFSPDGLFLVSCGDDKKMRFWRVGDRQPWRPPLDLDAPVRNLLFSPDGKLIVASLKGSILVWDYPTLKPHESIPAHKGSIFGLAFRRDGALASSGADGEIRLWRIDQPGSFRKLPAPGQQVMSLAFSPDGTLLASAGTDQLVHLWDPEKEIELGNPSQFHHDVVLSLAFSIDGKTLASAGRDKVIYLWDVKGDGWDQSNWKPRKTLFGHGATVWSLAFGKGGRLVSGGDDPSAILWSLSAPPRLSRTVGEFAGEVDSTVFSRTGDLLGVGGVDGTIRLWDTVSERLRGPVLRKHTGPVNALALHGRTLISGGEDGKILVWNLGQPLSDPKELADGDGSAPVQCLAFSKDGKSLAAGDSLGRVRLWEASSETFSYIGQMKERSPRRVYSLAFHPEGRLLAAGDVEGLIRIWKVKSRKLARKALIGHGDTVTGLAFDPQGRILASSSVDRTVRLWDARSWRQLAGSPLTGAESALLGVAFDAKGERIAASGQDGKILLWSVERRYLIGSGLQGDSSALNVAFHPDGNSLVTGTEKAALLFDLRDEAWRDLACHVVGRNLTDEERRKFLRYSFTRDACPGEKTVSSAGAMLDKIWRGR
jgi:WD40 repeat protein